MLGQSKGKGYGTRLLQDCADDAKHNGFAGVAVATSYEHWLPNRKIFLKQGFEQADTAPPAFELWVKRFDTQSPLPTFNRPSPKAKKMARGLTIYTSDQCPYIAITVQLLTQTAEKLNLPVTLVPIRNCKDAQRSPCVYGVTGVYLDGELVSYHPIGGKQLIEFMEKRDKKT